MASILKLWEVPRGPAQWPWGMKELRQVADQILKATLLLTGTKALEGVWTPSGYRRLEVQVHPADRKLDRNVTTGE